MFSTKFVFLLLVLLCCFVSETQCFKRLSFLNKRISSILFDVEIHTPTENVLSDRIIDISQKAMEHIIFLKSKQGEEMVLRMGVRAGGCSGMSYVMDMVSPDQITDDDHVEVYQGIKCAVDPKSLLFIFGLQLDYSDELIGGGFKFVNPNAETSCGCGKSFNV